MLPAAGRRNGARIAGRARRIRTKAPPLAPGALPFQDPLEEIIAEPPPALLRGPHHLVALLLAALVAVAALVEVDVVVVGSGRLAADAPPLVLQPIERAVIREIRVRPGEAVVRGQVLAVLDPTFTGADRTAIAAQWRALAAQRRRIEAELAGHPPDAGARPDNPGVRARPDGPEADEQVADPDTALQAVLHAQRRAQHAARLRAFDEDIRARQAALRATEESGRVLAQQLALATDVEQMRGRLLEGQVGSRLQFLGARAQRLQAEQEQRLADNRATELLHALRSQQAERQNFLDDWQRQLLEDLVRVRGELARVAEALTKAARLHDLTQIIAPMDGVVMEVARRSVGSVLREAEPLVTMLPAETPLVAEIAIESADVGYARAGDPVVVKVDAFPFQRHGTLSGTLRSIGQESFDRGAFPAGAEPAPTGASAGGAAHRGRVTLNGAGLTGLPEGTGPIPGMTVIAEIRVGSRSALSYFLDPITRGFRESLREP